MEKNIYIVGAHSRGRTFNEYITKLYPETTVVSFLVDDLSENEGEIDGIPVIGIDSSTPLNTDYPVYLATRGVYHEKLIKELGMLGMKYIYPVDVELDSRLRNAYVRRVFEQNNRQFVDVDEYVPKHDVSARIYVASSVFDSSLQTEYVNNQYERIIQVGTALTEKRLSNATAFDNTGDNISEKNKQYCELTAMYWIWKNAQQDIVGLVHYRRHFILPHNWLEWMFYNNIDVILPVPLYVAPSIAENYKNRHVGSDWDFMMDYIRNTHASEYESIKGIFNNSLYSPCNMFIMRKEVLDSLCEWMFPILEAVEIHCGIKDDSYQNRYPGFMSERLITCYFELYRDRYRIAYANKNFLK